MSFTAWINVHQSLNKPRLLDLFCGAGGSVKETWEGALS